VVCQDFRFSNQLLLGVRWFDVRYDNVDDRLHHSYFVLSRSLDNIICDARDFLSSHPTETVVFLIKKEYGGSTDGTFSDKVWSIIQKYSSTLFYQDDNLPTLGDVRGKIVIATHDDSNRNGHLLGPNYSWPDNTELFYGYTTSFTYYVQDHFSINHVSYGAKSNEIRALIDISVGYPDPHRVDLNYTSAEKDAEATSIKTVAHNINGNIRDYLLANSEWRRCGALMLNYAGGSDDNLCYPDLVRLIIQHNEFPHVNIGNQTWMGSNLTVTKYANGDAIQKVTDPNEWQNLISGAYCEYNNVGNSYGNLYNWYAVTDPRGLAPAGWHVPSSAEWDELIQFAGGTSMAGFNLKDVGTLHWWQDLGIDAYFFRAFPGGQRDGTGTFGSVGESGFWWCSSAINSSNAINYWMNFDNTAVIQQTNLKTSGYTVRCIKD